MSRSMGLTEQQAFESAADRALEAAEEIGPEAVAEVNRAIRAADDDHTSTG